VSAVAQGRRARKGAAAGSDVPEEWQELIERVDAAARSAI